MHAIYFVAHRWFCVWALYWEIITECTIMRQHLTMELSTCHQLS